MTTTSHSFVPRLERNSILLEHASTLASIDHLRNMAFPLPEKAAPVHALDKDLSAEIERLDAEMRRLHVLREEVQIQRSIGRSMFAPIRQVPAEVLSNILAILVLGEPAHEQAKAARAVASVCLFWRTTARDTRALWTRVNYATAPTGTMEKLLDMHARLAGGLPLRICQEPGVYADAQLAEVMKQPSTRTAQWHGLSLHVNGEASGATAPLDLTSLLHVNITISSARADSLSFLANAPALRQVYVQFESPGMPLQLEMPAFPSLTSLTFVDHHGHCVEQFIPALRTCAASLQRLTLSILDRAGDFTPSDMGPLVFPLLSEIVLQGDAYRILCYAKAPSLESIAFKHIHSRTSRPFVSLLRLLVSSTPPIRALALTDVHGHDNDALVRCFGHLSGLESLHVEDTMAWCVMGHTVLWSMTICHSERAPLLPALTTMHLQYQRPRMPICICKTAREMLASRATERVVAGCTVRALRDVETNLDEQMRVVDDWEIVMRDREHFNACFGLQS